MSSTKALVSDLKEIVNRNDLVGLRAYTEAVLESEEVISWDVPSCINLRPLPLGGGRLSHDSKAS